MTTSMAAQLWIMIPVAAGLLFFALLIIVVLFCLKRRKARSPKEKPRDRERLAASAGSSEADIGLSSPKGSISGYDTTTSHVSALSVPSVRMSTGSDPPSYRASQDMTNNMVEPEVELVDELQYDIIPAESVSHPPPPPSVQSLPSIPPPPLPDLPSLPPIPDASPPTPPSDHPDISLPIDPSESRNRRKTKRKTDGKSARNKVDKRKSEARPSRSREDNRRSEPAHTGRGSHDRRKGRPSRSRSGDDKRKTTPNTSQPHTTQNAVKQVVSGLSRFNKITKKLKRLNAGNPAEDEVEAEVSVPIDADPLSIDADIQGMFIF